jgi:hypothetical protein
MRVTNHTVGGCPDGYCRFEPIIGRFGDVADQSGSFGCDSGPRLVVPRRGGAAGRAGRARRPRHRLEVGAALRPGNGTPIATAAPTDQRQLAGRRDLHSGQGQVALPVSCCGLFRCDDRLSPLSAKQDAAESKALPEPKLWEVRTIPSRALLTPTSTPLTHPRSSGSKPKVPLRRIANTAPYNISTMFWNRIIGRSSAGYALASIFAPSGELGARSPVTRLSI